MPVSFNMEMIKTKFGQNYQNAQNLDLRNHQKLLKGLQLNQVTPSINYNLSVTQQPEKRVYRFLQAKRHSSRWKYVEILYNIFDKMQGEHDFLISKTFVFQNQISLASENIDILLREDLEEINIRQIISIFTHKNAINQPLSYQIYNPEINHFIALDPTKSISRSFVYTPVIVIRYKEIEHQDNGDKQYLSNSKTSNDNKKERNRERSIREVLQYVKQWRNIHNTAGEHNNKVSLQEAAKIVGISKKSLDDYFCQLRLAQEYGFNFEMNMEQKIGVMRSFVKKFRPKGDLSIKHERLPKKLKVIEQMDDIRKIVEETRQQTKDTLEPLDIKLEPLEPLFVAEYEPPMAIIPEDEYQNKFYNSFYSALDDYDDPFINFTKKDLSKSFDIEPDMPMF